MIVLDYWELIDDLHSRFHDFFSRNADAADLLAQCEDSTPLVAQHMTNDEVQVVDWAQLVNPTELPEILAANDKEWAQIASAEESSPRFDSLEDWIQADWIHMEQFQSQDKKSIDSISTQHQSKTFDEDGWSNASPLTASASSWRTPNPSCSTDIKSWPLESEPFYSPPMAFVPRISGGASAGKKRNYSEDNQESGSRTKRARTERRECLALRETPPLLLRCMEPMAGQDLFGTNTLEANGTGQFQSGSMLKGSSIALPSLPTFLSPLLLGNNLDTEPTPLRSSLPDFLNTPEADSAVMREKIPRPQNAYMLFRRDYCKNTLPFLRQAGEKDAVATEPVSKITGNQPDIAI